MRSAIPLAVAIVLAAQPMHAEEAAPGREGDFAEGFSLLEEGTRLLLRGLMAEIGPALRELEEAFGQLDAYHPPEVLPNGDIIIRRKTPLDTEPQVGPDGEVEL